MTTDDDTPVAAAKPARMRRAKATADAAPPPPAKTASKSDTVIKLLLRAKGATPMELIAATDWQPHSLRAFLSGLRKKGRAVVREERKGGGFAYRIVIAPAAASVSDAKPDDTSPEASIDAGAEALPAPAAGDSIGA